MVAPAPAKSRATVEPSSVGAVPVDEVHAHPTAPAGPAEFEIPIVAMDSDEAENESAVASASPLAETRIAQSSARCCG